MEDLQHRFRAGAAEDVVIEVKQEAHHNEFSKGGQHDIDVQFIENFPQEKRKAILRKIDLRLPPFLALLYRKPHLLALSISNHPNRSG
jgi:hypothetical protein